MVVNPNPVFVPETFILRTVKLRQNIEIPVLHRMNEERQSKTHRYLHRPPNYRIPTHLRHHHNSRQTIGNISTDSKVRNAKNHLLFSSIEMARVRLN